MAMAVPLHRGLSNGSRISGQGCQFYPNCMKDSLENGFGSPRAPLRIIHVFGKLGVLLVVVLALSGSLYWAASISTASGDNVFRGHRRLQENLVAELSVISDLSLGGAKLKELDFCPPEYDDYVPCYYNVSENSDVKDPDRPAVYNRKCVWGSDKDQSCLVLPPRNYRIPLRWPTGRDFIWKENVKITGLEFSSGSLMKRMMVEEEQISFRSDSLMVDGVEDYAHQIAEMIGLMNESNFNEAGVRTVLDIGCGFGSFGAYLFTKQVLAMCIANYESSGSQVQITLERGIPAILGSFTSKQLPFPFLSFDMLHCARCGIEWEKNDGIFLVEVDRLLRPGGYFVWTSVASSHRVASNKDNEKWAFIREFAESLCWDMLSQQDETIVWKKTNKKKCYNSRKKSALAFCDKSHDIESPFYQPLEHCIRGTRSPRWIPIEDRTPWPLQSNLNSTELNVYGVHPEDFAEDTIYWNSAIRNYWSLLSPLIFSDHPKRPGDEEPSPPFNMLRNVLDMNAKFGGFNAALLDAGKSVWVMNAVPTGGPDYLSLILDRGFIGVQHDWCEAFPTYPRTYDMVHAEGLLSLETNQRRSCSITHILLEVDRILRPEGWLILHDTAPLIEEARTTTTQLKWDARMIELESNSDAKLLICQKPFFRRQQY